MGISKSSQSSSSSNQAFPMLASSLGGSVGNVGAAGSALSALLGGDNSGLKGYQKATGFNQQLNYGMRGVTGAGAAGGLLNSGSTGKGLMNYGNMLSNQSSQNFVQNLLGLGQLGLGAGGVLAGAGNTSNSKGSSKGLQLGVPGGGGG